MDRIHDPEVRLLASLAVTIASDYLPTADDPWLHSPFKWVLQTPSRTRGAIGENLVAGWCAAKGFDVIRPKNSQADRIINGQKVEIKLSTLWKSGVFKFQQIRDQDYDYALCIGISPFDAQAWLIPKQILLEHVIGKMGQHTGASGSDTAWISFKSSSPYEWMSPFGDRLSDVEKILRSLTEHH